MDVDGIPAVGEERAIAVSAEHWLKAVFPQIHAANFRAGRIERAQSAAQLRGEVRARVDFGEGGAVKRVALNGSQCAPFGQVHPARRAAQLV